MMGASQAVNKFSKGKEEAINKLTGDAVEGVVNVHLQIDCDVHMWNFRIMTLPWHSPIYVPPVQLWGQQRLCHYWKITTQKKPN
ncbi:Hypothetical predicted protein [Mytilus galloprovincialis]|uniref:Uncharacterized protein n=1 Tax=Mytilus galloprovincialis TaxID=29158 RepID=A0A8B6GAE2_MYTGA|nr:Hypothetical predicted protein [Mytilus galloprovincialis]VDI80045.1 Hypothetical predicted protein [Mytilus galloprovincialis]